MQHGSTTSIAARIDAAIEFAGEQRSRLSARALALPGYSSGPIRHFLNLIASPPGTRYLEVGTWKGSTLIAAAYGNPGEFMGLDNFSQFRFRQWGSPRAHLERHLSAFAGQARAEFIEADCFEVDLRRLPRPVDVFLYDGDHARASHRDVFLRFEPVFAERFIALVDDWNWRRVREGTKAAFAELGFEVEHERELYSRTNGDAAGWWNGFYVAAIRKRRSVSKETEVAGHARLLGASSYV